MKKLFSLLMVILITFSVFAQAPQKMSYQCVVRNASGVLVTNQSVGIRIRILQGSVTGAIVYKETYSPNPQTNANGLFSIEIGGGFPIIGTFSAIDWAAGPYFLMTETDPTGGSNYTIIGTSQLLSVPYALHAQTAGSSTDAVKISGDQTIAGHKSFSGITTVATPINGTDAANKEYVDLLLKEINLLKALFGVSSVTDIDGNTYTTKCIGTQTWMIENLKTTKYNNGDLIGTTPNIHTSVMNESEPKYQWGYLGESLVATRGRLYTWYAATDSRGVCPTGWHIPSDSDWKTLEIFLGMSQEQADSSGRRGTDQGAQMKTTSGWKWTSHFLDGNGTNTSGFSAIGAGHRSSYGAYNGGAEISTWWSSCENATDLTLVWTRSLRNEDSKVGRYTAGDKKSGASVRCLKDKLTGK